MSEYISALLGGSGACKAVLDILRKHGESSAEAAEAVRLFFFFVAKVLYGASNSMTF